MNAEEIAQDIFNNLGAAAGFGKRYGSTYSWDPSGSSWNAATPAPTAPKKKAEPRQLNPAIPQPTLKRPSATESLLGDAKEFVLVFEDGSKSEPRPACELSSKLAATKTGLFNIAAILPARAYIIGGAQRINLSQLQNT